MRTSQSNAGLFFEQIRASADPFAFLSALVDPTSPPANPIFEEEWLEFKRNPHPKDALKIWSEAVSGFANTAGGVIVWGIDCRKQGDIDYACALDLILNPLSFRTILANNTHQTAEPAISGIQIEHYAGGDEKGFVVCFVPESDHKPHRAVQRDGHPYVMRVGDSFKIMPHSFLRAMFYPRLSPQFEIEVQPRSTQNEASLDVLFDVQLKNTGRASAHDVIASLTFFGFEKTGSRRNGWLRVQPGAGDDSYRLPYSLHPEMSCQMPSIKGRIALPGEPRASVSTGDSLVELAFTIYSRDCSLSFLEIAVTHEDIRSGSGWIAE